MITPTIEESLHARLRRAPSRFTVPESLPILFFGDLLTARIATVGLNPSRREYTDKRDRELDGPQRRFETLRSLGATDRAILSPEQCNKAVATMRAYYRPSGPAYSWFAPLVRVVRGMGFEYATGDVAHLDLVQEATDPTWSALNAKHPDEALALRTADGPFLRWQMEAFPLNVLVCNGRTVFDGVCQLTEAEFVASHKIARLNCHVAVAKVGGRRLGVIGWNIPLARPTGLTSEDQVALGRHFAQHLAELRLLPQFA
ncbi:MAG: hypothetical protein ACRDJW_09900 [Thermomicrobiales bacterium]